MKIKEILKIANEQLSNIEESILKIKKYMQITINLIKKML